MTDTDSTDETSPPDSASEEPPPPLVGDVVAPHPPRILLPVAVLDGQQIAEPLVDFLAAADVVLLGYHVIPEQTPAEQASLQYEDRAQDAVEAIATMFEPTAHAVETRTAFTHDRDQTIDRVAKEANATAVLLPNPSGEIKDVLVLIRDGVDVDRMGDLLAALLGRQSGSVTLLGLAGEESAFSAEPALAEARKILLERGFDPERLMTDTTVSDTPVRTVVEGTAGYDIVVMGEGGSSLLTALLGDTPERVAEESFGPVLVVRQRQDTEEKTP
jgi:hypothetical protein